ncbi:nucleoporin Nup186/Nup192/Nup205 [Xylariaceae sp. FL0594]|nr:nucleoporin Nup186/Nup192/Nup205 [Xylariaceae sp. FL0594]
MADDGTLEALQALHRDLTTVVEALKEDREERGCIALAQLPDSPLLETVADVFQRFLDKPERAKSSRDAVLSGKVKIGGDEWVLNKDFQEVVLQIADEIDLDEIEATKLALQAEAHEEILAQPRKECAIILFHQQRKYILSCMILLLELQKEEDDLMADDVGDGLGRLSPYVNHNILREVGPGAPPPKEKFVPACTAGLANTRTWLQKLSERASGAAMRGLTTPLQLQESYEYAHVSLMEQHELLAVILCYAVERHMADESDFIHFMKDFAASTRYDYSIVHRLPVVGTYITMFGSTESNRTVAQSRKLNKVISDLFENGNRTIPFLDAAIRAWWLAEYSGWYVQDAAGSGLPDVDLDREDMERSKQFQEALKDGAFDFLLAVVLDAKITEWQDPWLYRVRGWVQKRTPALPPDTVPFSEHLQERLNARMETFIDAFISNMPDVLRKLKIEEDELRQTGQLQDQDVDLERFLLIIAYSYEGRPEAADAFWADPDSNLAGFLQWASRRTSTPLQIAFCEMLQCLSDDSDTATSAHEFLLDEGHQLRKPSSITWATILKELEYHIKRARGKHVGPHAAVARVPKLENESADHEHEFVLLQEAYLRLITKLASQSEPARLYLLLQRGEWLVELLFKAISSAVGPQIRAAAFKALGALMTRKALHENHGMWQLVDRCFTGGYISSASSARTQGSAAALPHPSFFMEALFQEMSPNFDETSTFIQFLTVLTTPPLGSTPLNDVLPYPESLGIESRTRPGIDPYIDFVLGHVFSMRLQENFEVVHQRALRCFCLEFALVCVSTFNEDLIIFANESNMDVDAAIRSKNLETYVTLHPFARAMEWMYDSRFIKSIFDTIHQSPADSGKAPPDSPLIIGVLRAVELISKALDLQATFTDLVRPIVKPQSRAQSRSPFTPTPNAAYSSIEDGLMASLTLVSDLGGYCGLGHPDLTLASLKLLEKISSSPKVISAWQSGFPGLSHRNKAIVALVENGDAQRIAGTLTGDLAAPLDFRQGAASPGYQIKTYILDFLYSCLKANPDRPTIAHLLLGFRCSANALDIEPEGAFDKRNALFHSLLPVMIDVPIVGDEGIATEWLLALKYKAMRIFKLLWSSPLSAGLVLEELRENDFLFQLLLRGLMTQQGTRWDGQEANGPDFLTHQAAKGYIEHMAVRAMTLEYIAHELCSVMQSQLPALKRRIFDALGGQIVIEGMESIPVASVFDFQNSLPNEELFALPPPELKLLNGLDLRPCLEEDDDGNTIYNLDKVHEILLLKRNESPQGNQLILQQDAVAMESEEASTLAYVLYLSRLTQLRAYSVKMLRSWTRLLMVMTDCNDFKGTSKVSFILQTLQATLPGIEAYGFQQPVAALELAKLAKVLLFKLEFGTMVSKDRQSRAVENLVSDKLYQLLEVCLDAVAKWVGNQELRSIYYGICYRYLTGIIDHDHGSLSDLRKVTRTIQAYGEKLLNVLCDDAFGADAECQSSALILLTTLVQLGRKEDDNYVVETLNKLNFVGVLVDSLRGVLEEWVEINHDGDADKLSAFNAKLALLLQLCQTCQGAKYVLHANLFRTVEQCGLFSVDPELQVNSSDPQALEKHYVLLVRVARILSTAIVSRGSHNMIQGRRFLMDHRTLVAHVLKRSAGVGAGSGKIESALADRIEELAEAFIVMITTTGFLEFEDQSHSSDIRSAPVLFH